jgi:pimeloyl-ACP methyl ester carboxylesterase
MAVSVTDAEGGVAFPFDKAALIETIHASKAVSVRTWLRALGTRGMPVLVLRGAESRVWSREEFEAERTALGDLPSIRFEEVAGTGHGLPFEKRAEFVARLRAFFQA